MKKGRENKQKPVKPDVKKKKTRTRTGTLSAGKPGLRPADPRRGGGSVNKDIHRDVFDGVMDAWYFHDLEGRFLETNAAFRRMLGYPENQPLPENFRIEDLLSEDMKHLVSGYIETIMRDRKSEGLMRVSCPDGSEKFIEYKNAMVFDGNGKAIGVRGMGRDITERYLARKEMKEIEQRYRDIFDNVTDLLFFHDLDGNFDLKQCNPAVRQQLVGGNPEIETVNIREFMPEAYRAGFDEYLERIKKNGRDEGLFTIINFAGRESVMEYRNSLVSDKNGPIGVRGSARDITDRIIYERALRMSEEKYRTILESIEHGYYEVDTAGDITFFNDSFCRIFDIPKDELIGKNYKTFIDEETAKKVYDVFHTVYSTGRDMMWTEWEFITRKGRKISFEASISCIMTRSGKCRGFRGIVRDVTERVATEQALKESESKYRNILEGIEEGYYETDLKGRYTFMNDSMCRITGFSREEMTGMSYKNCMDEENARRVFEAFRHVFASGEPMKGFGWDFTRKDGSKVQVESSILLIQDPQGRPAGFKGILQDVSERKKAQEQTRLLEERLKNAQKMEALGTLAGGVAHDLNNILSGIVSYPEMLLMKIDKDDPLRGPLEKIQKSGQKAAAVVQDLLTLARRGVAVKQVVKLNGLIREYLESSEFGRLQSLHPNVRIDFRHDDSLMNIIGSPAHLSKAIMNLISNAAEAMPKGGTITIETCNLQHRDLGECEGNIKEEGRWVSLSVTDTGKGIPAEDIPRIFEPFYTKKKMGYSGTGLGLAVVWGAVQDHDGSVAVASREGKTTFTLNFPATSEQITEAKAKQLMKDYQGKGEHILVVDDSKEQREIAAEILMMLGYRVDTVSSGESAIEYMKGHSADLILLDMIMEQGIDGLETYERILELHPGQKVIIASGYSETDRVKQAQSLGAGRYIKKPYLIEDLAMAVMQELRKDRA